MKTAKQATDTAVTRRDALKLSGLALGSLAVGGVAVGTRPRTVGAGQPCGPNGCDYPSNGWPTQQYTYPTGLDPVTPNTPLEDDEMRITFLGSMVPPVRRAQQEMSIFVEVGPGSRPPMHGRTRPSDGHLRLRLRLRGVRQLRRHGNRYGRMDKIFLTHLHADHMSDLSTHLLLRPSATASRPSMSGARALGREKPKAPRRLLRRRHQGLLQEPPEGLRWHTESFSFLPTSYEDYPIPTRKSWGLPLDPVPVGDDRPTTATPWSPSSWTGRSTGRCRETTSPTTTRNRREDHPFPGDPLPQGLHRLQARVERPHHDLHERHQTRDPSASTRPKSNGGKGVDVFIHEMVLPPELWAMKNMNLTAPDQPTRISMPRSRREQGRRTAPTPPRGPSGTSSARSPPARAHGGHPFPGGRRHRGPRLQQRQSTARGWYGTRKTRILPTMIWSADLMVLSVKKKKRDHPDDGQRSPIIPSAPPSEHARELEDSEIPHTPRVDGSHRPARPDAPDSRRVNKDGTAWNYCENGY